MAAARHSTRRCGPALSTLTPLTTTPVRVVSVCQPVAGGMTTLPQITEPMPIYDALLLLATAEERATIIDAGPREWLDDRRTFCGGAEHDAAMAAFEAIKAILARVTMTGSGLRVTGIDPRMMPPCRVTLDRDTVRLGTLRWESKEGYISKLMLMFLHPIIHLGDLRIEPTNDRTETRAPVKMSQSPKLDDGERLDDTERLILMQQFIDQGMRPKTAARNAAVEKPYPHSTEDATVTRLCRKFRKRLIR